MSLVIQTGRSLTIEVDGVDYSYQTAEVTLTPSQTVDQYISLTTTAAIAQPVTWELSVRAWQDWGEATSFTEAMFAAASAGAPIPFELSVANGGVFSGNIIPVFPSVGGTADSALELEISFAVDGDVTYTPGV
jgi:hypothetical protein